MIRNVSFGLFVLTTCFAVSVRAAELYHETYRPQFHFSPRTNWTNDPNGLVFYEGEFWHGPTKKWIMALYLDGHDYILLSSPNLKDWSKLCDLPKAGGSECPDFFELPVDGNAQNTRWVFWAGNSTYILGKFDGRIFTRESGPHAAEFGKNFYAAQTYSDIPPADGRRIQIGWMQGGRYPGMPFNQQMSFPCVLTLRTFPEGIRLCRQPVREIAALRGKEHKWSDLKMPGKESPLKISGELLEVRAEIEPGEAGEIVWNLRGEVLKYDAAKREISCQGKTARLEPIAGRIKLDVLLDRSSIEVFGSEGKVPMSFCFLPKPEDRTVSVYASGPPRLVAMTVYELKSAW